MILKDELKENCYYLDLYDKWWHFYAFWFVGFFPHKVTKIERRSKLEKPAFKMTFSIFMGLILFRAFLSIIFDSKSFVLHPDFRYIVYPISYFMTVFCTWVIWQFTKKETLNACTFKNVEPVEIKGYLTYFEGYRALVFRLIFKFIYYIVLYQLSKLYFIHFFTISFLCSFFASYISMGAIASFNFEIDGNQLRYFPLSTKNE